MPRLAARSTYLARLVALPCELLLLGLQITFCHPERLRGFQPQDEELRSMLRRVHLSGGLCGLLGQFRAFG